MEILDGAWSAQRQGHSTKILLWAMSRGRASQIRCGRSYGRVGQDDAPLVELELRLGSQHFARAAQCPQNAAYASPNLLLDGTREVAP